MSSLGTCQEISNWNSSDFQEAQTSQTNIMVDFFSEVEAKGSELNKKGTGCLEMGGMQREQHWKLPPLVLGLHLMELIALAILTVHCIFTAMLWDFI